MLPSHNHRSIIELLKWMNQESGSVITRKAVMLPAHSPRMTAKKSKMNGPKPWFYNHR